MTEVGHVGGIGYTYDVKVDGDYACTANGASGLKVFDVSTPSNPVCIATRSSSGNSACVEFAGDYLYLGDGPGGFKVYDRSSPSNPVEIAHIDDFVGHVSSLDAAEAYLYVGYRDTPGFRVYDVSNPTNPVHAGHADDVLSEVWGLTVSNGYAYLGASGDGLLVYDVSSSTSPVKVASSGLAGGANRCSEQWVCLRLLDRGHSSSRHE